MANRERRQERAAWLMRRDAGELGVDLRSARLSAGLTLRAVGRMVGVSPQSVLRTERGRFPPGPSLDVIARHAAAVGMRARIKAYPGGEPLRDAPQLALMRIFLGLVPSTYPFHVEVHVSDQPGDMRAWDAVLELPGCRCALEFVTRFHDCQAQLRAFQLKLRDGNMDRLIIVVKATHANRRAVGAAANIIAAAFPLGTRTVMAALTAGRDPGANGLVFL